MRLFKCAQLCLDEVIYMKITSNSGVKFVLYIGNSLKITPVVIFKYFLNIKVNSKRWAKDLAENIINTSQNFRRQHVSMNKMRLKSSILQLR